MKSFTPLAIALLIPVLLQGQGGILKESLKCPSKILGRDVEYSIYLPADYESSQRHYPTLYLLHGYTDDETGWTQFGEVKAIAIQPDGMIVVGGSFSDRLARLHPDDLAV